MTNKTITEIGPDESPVPLTLAHRAEVERDLLRHPPAISEHTFTNLYAWGQTRKIFCGRIEGSLVFLVPAGDDRFVLLGPPLGDTPLETVFSRLAGRLIGAIRVPAMVGMDRLGLEVIPDPNNSDYLYKSSDLAELAGRKFAKKRNQVKKALAAATIEYHSLTYKDGDECISMLDRWCRLRGCRHDPGLCGEYQAIVRSLALFDGKKLFGGALYNGGEMIAFAIGEQLNRETAVCHFEKAMPLPGGAGQVINQMFAKNELLGHFALVNREQDLGIEGLRQAKRSYHPVAMVMKYRIGRTVTSTIKAEACPEP